MGEVRNCYVYGWFNNDWRVYFYVGRGRDGRYKDTRNRSKAFNAVINRFDCESVILADGLTIEEAEQVENERKHYLMFELGHPILDGESKNLRAKCQAEGIAATKAAGKYKGRQPIPISEELLKDVHTAWYKNEITTAHAIKRLGVSRNTFYRRMWEYEEEMGIPKKKAGV